MLHFTVECSGNIRGEADLPGLFAKANLMLTAANILPPAGIRSRMHWVDTWQVADGQHDYALVHMTLEIGTSRSLEGHQQAGGTLFELIRTCFTALIENRLLTLPFKVGELHPTLNFK